MALETEEALTEVARNMNISRGERPDPEPNCMPLDKAKNMEVFDESGTTIRFGDLYKNQKTIVIFIRNFLCFMTKEYVDDLARIPENYLKEANVRLVVIGCGPYKFIKDFRAITGYKLDLYCDPDRKVYKALGCSDVYKYGKTNSSAHVKSGYVMGVLSAAWRGMWHREWQGDVSQQGGAFILGPENIMHYKHLDILPIDHMPINELLDLAGVEKVSFQKDHPVLNI